MMPADRTSESNEGQTVAGLGWEDVWKLRKAAARVRYGTAAGQLDQNGQEEDAQAADHLDSLADRIAALLRAAGVTLR